MPTRRILMTLAACLVATLLGPSAVRAQTATFDFNAVPAMTASPLTLTQNGLTVTFTDDLGLPVSGKPYSDDGQFAVGATEAGYSSRFSGNVLSSLYGYSGAHHPLVMLFQQPIYGISLDYGTDHTVGAAPPVILSAYEGKTLVGTETEMPQTLVLSPEGHFDFSSATPFDSVTLASPPSQYLMVDNVAITDVGPTPVPEASTAAMFAVGLLFLAGLGARARRCGRPGV